MPDRFDGFGCAKAGGADGPLGILLGGVERLFFSPKPICRRMIANGEITVGVQHSVGCVATATDGHNCLAMLVRGQRETLVQLLTRLDQAIDKALTDDVYIDEMNS